MGHEVAYIRLHKKAAQVETIHVSDELNVDLAPGGARSVWRGRNTGPRNPLELFSWKPLCFYSIVVL